MVNEREKYARYLASREWSILKEAVIARSGGICERCNYNKMDHVHHLTYARKYHEDLTDLQAICAPCHEYTHAKSNVDPIMVNPAILIDGQPIYSVYLAGTCEPKHISDEWHGDNGEHEKAEQNWRKAITEAYFLGHRESAPDNSIVPDAIELPSGKKLSYTGPFIYYDHSIYAPNEHGGADGGRETFAKAMLGIARASLVFAWVDRLDCYGTIAEIGRTYSQCCLAIAGPKRFEDLWFVYEMAHHTDFTSADPATAFYKLFKHQPVAMTV